MRISIGIQNHPAHIMNYVDPFWRKKWYWSFSVSLCTPCRPTSPHTIISSARHQPGLKWSPFSSLSSILLDELHGSAYSQCEMSWAKVVLLGQLCLNQREENEWLGVLLGWLEIGNTVWTWRGRVVFREMCIFLHVRIWSEYMIIANNMWRAPHLCVSPALFRYISYTLSTLAMQWKQHINSKRASGPRWCHWICSATRCIWQSSQANTQ